MYTTKVQQNTITTKLLNRNNNNINNIDNYICIIETPVNINDKDHTKTIILK